VRVAAYIRDCAQGRNHLRLWKRGEPPETAIRAHWFCRSWRHPGRCALERSQEDRKRISCALATVAAQHVVFMVLTMNPADWESQEAMYEGLKECWRPFAKAIRREWGAMRYVSTVERTKRKGVPHLNVVMECAGMGDALASMPKYVLQWSKDHAQACGFGFMVSVEVAKSAAQLAGYIVKLADASCVAGAAQAGDAVVGEVVKLSQLPRDAPKGHRRLRSSPRFLPPAREESEWTGGMERAPHPDEMSPEQRGRLRLFEEGLAEQARRREVLAATGYFEKPEAERLVLLRFEMFEDPAGRWDRSQAPPSRAHLTLDMGPAPPGEEWLDDGLQEWERERELRLAEVRRDMSVALVQGELF
jgi:hypothetical protein